MNDVQKLHVICTANRKKYEADSIYQYDQGKVLYVSGLQSNIVAQSPEAHFAIDGTNEAMSVLPVVEEGTLQYRIPNVLTFLGETIVCYLFVALDDIGITTIEVKIPVIKRQKPTGFVYSEEEHVEFNKLLAEFNRVKNDADQIITNANEKITQIDEKIDQSATAINNVNTAVDHIKNMTANAESVPSNNAASASVTEKTDGFHFDFKIPKGKDGVSTTHEWNGTTLSVTSASGTSSADLKGQKGDDGFSPSAKVDETADGATITIIDKNGTTTANIPKGRIGEDGFSPTVSVTQENNGVALLITDKNGTKEAKLLNGADGYSPTVNMTEESDGTTISITDKEGTKTTKIVGKAGKDGKSGVFIGNVEPTDPDVNVWVDTTKTPPAFVSCEKQALTDSQKNQARLNIGAVAKTEFDQLSTDTTLSVEGKAADAKKVGTELSQLKIDIGAKANKSIVSDAWKTGQTYEKGAYCIYNDNLYKALVQTTAEPTSESDWEKCTITGELNNHQPVIVVHNQSDSTKETLIALIANAVRNNTGLFSVTGSWTQHPSGYSGTVNTGYYYPDAVMITGTIYAFDGTGFNFLRFESQSGVTTKIFNFTMSN